MQHTNNTNILILNNTINVSMLIGLVVGLVISLLVIPFFVPHSSADTEPNDSFNNAELVKEGSYRGNIDSSGYQTYKDRDFYKINVPSNYDLNIDIENKNPKGGAIITIEMYDENHILIESDDENTGKVRAGKEEFFWVENRDDEDIDVYLVISGDGDYKFTLDLDSLLERTLYYALCASPLIIVAIVVIIYLRRRNKRRAKELEESTNYYTQQMEPRPPPPPPMQPPPPRQY